MVQTFTTEAGTVASLSDTVNKKCSELVGSGYEILNVFPITIGDSKYVAGMIVYETTPVKKEEYVTVTELNDKLASYATVVDMNQRALKTDIPNVPTTISSFTNDKGYITKSEADSYYQAKL